jgi:hypothetical protein
LPLFSKTGTYKEKITILSEKKQTQGSMLRNRKYHRSCGSRITPFSYLRDIEKTGGLLFSSHQNVVEQRNVCTTATVEVSFKNRYQPKRKNPFFLPIFQEYHEWDKPSNQGKSARFLYRLHSPSCRS